MDNLDDIKDKEVVVTDKEQAAIDKIYEDYYNNWDWVYGNSPEFTVKKRQHFDAGTVDARFLVDQGKIKNVKFYGDFFGPGDATELADKMAGVRYDHDTLKALLDPIDTNKYFNGIPKEELLNLFV